MKIIDYIKNEATIYICHVQSLCIYTCIYVKQNDRNVDRKW